MAKSTTFKGAPKPFGGSGHFNEPRRHSLQAKGFKTGHFADRVLPPSPKGRLVVQKFRVYKFDDLPKEVQQKALDEHREMNVNFDWWDYDGQLDLSEDEMKIAGIQPLPKDWSNRKLMPDQIHYEGVEYPAYTGLFKYNVKNMEFDLDRGRYLQFKDLKVNDDNIFRKWLGIPEKIWSKVTYRFVNERENNTQLEFDTGDVSMKDANILLNASQKWDNKMKEAWKNLYDEYYRRLSDEEVAESLRANEYEFTDKGKIF